MHHTVWESYICVMKKSHSTRAQPFDGVILPRYSLAYKYPHLCQLVFLLPILLNVFQIFSPYTCMHIKSASEFKQYSQGMVFTRKLSIGTVRYKTIRGNIIFVYSCVIVGAFTTLLTRFGILLLVSGDVHANPGQPSTSSHSSSSSTTNTLNFRTIYLLYSIMCRESYINLTFSLLNYLTLTF